MGARSCDRSASTAAAVSRALRALAICGPAALVHAPPAAAQTHDAAALVADIPARPLAEALAAFARQTGLELVYVSGVVRNRRSHAAAAGLDADQALARLLKGTGLRYEYLTPHTIRVFAAAVTPLGSATDVSGSDELQDVIVTASRREEDLRQVPITIQVLGGDALARLNATTFDDIVSLAPGVTAHGVGPGQSDIYVRGLATTGAALQSSGSLAPFPSVAVYLDDQSVQLPGRNLDIYAADLARIEILEGPQGTLFGAGAEAGVVRYITNKPQLDVTETALNAGFATTAHGERSNNVDAIVNIPVIAGRLAVRGVVYNESRGGYIDNVAASFARADSDLGTVSYFANGRVPANSVMINNLDIAARAINPVTYHGIRVTALYQFNDDWSAVLARSYQAMAADGVFAEMAANSLGVPQRDLTVQLYNRSYDKDRFANTALTIDGRVGTLRLVYAGAYLVRNVEQVQDYTNYSRGAYADYYQCVNPGATAAMAQCFTPSATWHDVERNTHQSHELRLSTSDDGRIRAVGGVFYENYRIAEQVDWFYLTALPYYNAIGPPTGYYSLNGSTHLPDGRRVSFRTPGAVFVPAAVTVSNPAVRPLGDGFFDDMTRGYQQRAAYASVDLDLVPGRLTLTAGTRYSRTETSEVGANVGSVGCGVRSNPPNPCLNHSNFVNLDAKGLDKTFSGFKSRANLSWKVSEDALLYLTWSQGFRAGGFNRSADAPVGKSPLAAGPNPWQAQALAHGGWREPQDFAPDSLTNQELGWKTTWAAGRIQWDGAFYREDWDHPQITLYSTDVITLAAISNGGKYRVQGVESSVAAHVITGLTINASAAWNHGELVKQAPFRWADGVPIDFSTLQNAGGQAIPHPDGAVGSPLAAPPFQGNVRARYALAFNGYAAFAQVGATHRSHTLATTDRLRFDLQATSVAYDLPAFTSYDGALGVGRDAWLVQVYAENLTDTRAQLYANYAQYYKALTVSRPRTVGLRLSYKFGSG